MSCGLLDGIFLWMVLGLVFNYALYLVMSILQFVAVCLVMILWAFSLAFLPMLARSSMHCLCSVRFVGKGGMMTFLMSCKALIFGLFWRCVWEFWHAARIALQMVWCVVI